MQRHLADPHGGSNCVLIPDPSRLLDPIYLTAHAVVDQIPRSKLTRLIPLLMRSMAPGDGPPARDHGHPPDQPPPDTPPADPPLRLRWRPIEPG